MAKCKNCKHLGYLFDGDKVGERVWCGNIADSPVLDMERDCEYYVPHTNADRIISMTDEELAVNMMCPNENGLAEIDCDKNDNCNCYECLLKWLKAESEE